MGFLKDKLELARQSDAAKERAPSKPSEGRKKKSKGLLERAGLKVERDPSPEESEEQKRSASILKVWEYLRRQIDQGCAAYLSDGSSDKLREFVGRPAIDSLLAHLDSLRASGVYWEQPDRRKQTNPRVSVVSDNGDRFVVEERFSDSSLHRLANGAGESRCGGDQRVIRATVEVKGGQHFKLLNVIKVQRADL